MSIPVRIEIRMLIVSHRTSINALPFKPYDTGFVYACACNFDY